MAVALKWGDVNGSKQVWINKDNDTDLSTLSNGAGLYVNGTIVINPGSGTNAITFPTNKTGVVALTSDITVAPVSSVQVQATSPVNSSTSTAQTGTVATTISLANEYGDTKNPYGTKSPNYILAGPSSGTTAAAPSFRQLVAADIPNITKSKISDFPSGLTEITNDTSSTNKISGALYCNNSIITDMAVFTNGKTSVSNGAKGASLGRHGILYLQGDTDYSPSIYFYGKTGGTSRTSSIIETTDGKLTLTASAGFESQFLSHYPTDATTYQISFNSSTTDADGQYLQYINNGLRYRTRGGTASTDGLAMLQLGNNTASGTTGNTYGVIQMYGTGTNYIQLRPATSITGNRTIYLPNKGGTIALTNDLVEIYNDSTGTSSAISFTLSDYSVIIVHAKLGGATNQVSTICCAAGEFKMCDESQNYYKFTLSSTGIGAKQTGGGSGVITGVYGIK